MGRTGKLEGRVAVVTGGGGAIGGAICRLYASEGARVVVVDAAVDAAEKVAADIRRSDGEAVDCEADVSDPDQARAAVEAAVAGFDALHLLVNVAAAVTPDAPVEKLALKDWNRAFAVNLTGPFLMAKYAIPHMRAAGGGAIVNIASQLGQIGVPDRSAYCTTKAGLIHLTTILAAEVARDKIRVNSISPGVIETPRTLRRFETVDAFQAARGPLHMLGRVGTPDEVARAALFLGSDDASFTTATDLLVDGGYIYLKRQQQK